MSELDVQLLRDLHIPCTAFDAHWVWIVGLLGELWIICTCGSLVSSVVDGVCQTVGGGGRNLNLAT